MLPEIGRLVQVARISLMGQGGKQPCGFLGCAVDVDAVVQDVRSEFDNYFIIGAEIDDDNEVHNTVYQAMANANGKEVDLLVTWLFRLTNEYYNYKMASVIGIIVFIICAVFTLISFSKLMSGDREEQFQ